MTIRIAKQLDEVMSVLEFAEEEARAGSHVAVMLSYEAAPAFDSALVTHEPSEFPLAWASTFEDTTCHKKHKRRHRTVPEILCSSCAFCVPGNLEWSPLVERDEYDRAVARIRELIAAGDTYQVNYTFPLRSVFNGDAYELYRNLCVAQGAPYSTYLDLGRFKVLCLSPELFFERRGNHVVTKPMKGAASVKDRAVVV